MEEAPQTEERSDEPRSDHDVEEIRREPAGSLRVEERAELPRFDTLADAFRSRGFPNETATISADEFRSVTFAGGTVTYMNESKFMGGALGADQRFAWQAVQQQSVTAGVTSVTVTQQSARTLAAGTVTIRDIDATGNKPEVSSTLGLVNVPLNQVAGVQTGIPNVYLAQPQIETVIETDLRLSVYDGLDELVRAAIASSSNQAPSSDNVLVSVRKCITTLRASGYAPNLIILTPAASEAIDTMVSGITGADADFVFGPAQFAPGTLFGIPRVESKVIAAPVVMDTRAHGALYLSPLSLARFEENAGRTNTSLVRLEGHAAYGTERTAAAIRIAAS